MWAKWKYESDSIDKPIQMLEFGFTSFGTSTFKEIAKKSSWRNYTLYKPNLLYIISVSTMIYASYIYNTTSGVFISDSSFIGFLTSED